MRIKIDKTENIRDVLKKYGYSLYRTDGFGWKKRIDDKSIFHFHIDYNEETGNLHIDYWKNGDRIGRHETTQKSPSITSEFDKITNLTLSGKLEKVSRLYIMKLKKKLLIK